MDDQDAMDLLTQSTAVADVDPVRYDAVFLPGGHGTRWDLAQTDAVDRVVSHAYAGGAVVEAVCHGPAGLVGARRTDGAPLVAGKKVNSSSDAEEKAVGLESVVPCMMESKLRELGGCFEGNPDNFLPHAVCDDRWVTGQDPSSSKRVADLMLEALADQKSAI